MSVARSRLSLELTRVEKCTEGANPERILGVNPDTTATATNNNRRSIDVGVLIDKINLNLYKNKIQHNIQ